ncbi:YdeI/OmpD-associated family protein [Pedobacter sp. KR3-3]|uniref:YdeI/OmpD-associated family protein n=1 Tax=Pedobacter albus TaxID=3113905 RepID=A0ABU7I7C9_9SPHI|nr:YdeI/OmpD-associated family protein [Pedobacter sp. KR3-3]MEE1945353.1 YdeI/OmpD-associated family protein [Pedobacter sp. KR3-3]
MKQFDERVDAYIEQSAGFAQPILKQLRAIIHEASPLINETIKWGFPHFDYKGTVCSMAAFKAHCAFGFWKTSLMKDPYQLFDEKENAMGSLGRLTKLEDLPEAKILIEYTLEAIKLNEAGVKVKKVIVPKAAIAMPADFAGLLAEHPRAQQQFEAFSPSHRREYLAWITEAKTEATKNKRMATAIEWLSEGKSRNWKYER